MEKNIFVIIGATLFFVVVITTLIMVGQNGMVSDDESFTKILKKGTIKVGTKGEYPPFSHYENDELTGFDIELTKEIMERMGIEVAFVVIPWIELFNEVKAEKVDIIIGAITITPERSQEMLFGDPYFLTGQTLLVQKENTEINSAGDLGDKRVGIKIGTTSASEAIKHVSGIKFIAYEDTLPIIEDLKKGIIEATIMDHEAANKMARDNDDLKVVGDLLTEEYYGIATNKKNIALMSEINEVLQKMKDDGTLDELKKKWFD